MRYFNLLVVLSILTFHLSETRGQINDSTFSSLDFRYIGPDGNRTIAVAGVPGNRMISYAGAASGGIFKTEDAGLTWKPIFDEQDNSSIGALAIAPSNPSIVWAGTGETFLIRPAHAVGNGVYKSTDAGKTWKNMGLQLTARISRVIVHPTNPDIVYVAAMGHSNGPQQERGIYKTIDGGVHWERSLFIDENTGCSDLAMDHNDPETLYAAGWQLEIKTWKLNSGGPGSGIYRTKNGGKTWEPLRNGLPGGAAHVVGKTSVDIAYSNTKVIYALIEDKEPGLYRSDDGGDSWKLMNRNHSMGQRAPYYTRLRVATNNENKVYTICTAIMTTLDGGKTFTTESGDYRGGGDCHDMWIDPLDSNRIMVAHDVGMNMTFNNGASWETINLPIAQMYHVAVDHNIPYNVIGNRQDGYSYRGPSNSLESGISTPMWVNVGGCESGFAQPDPVDNNIIWSGCYDGGLDVTDVTTGHTRDVRPWPVAGFGWTPANMKYRWHWNFPLMISKHHHNKVLIGSQYVHETTNGGQSWRVISPDLTLNDKSHQQNSGGVSIDNLFTFDGSTLYSIAESPLKEGIIWTGSNDGQINVTTDGGLHWKNVTKNVKGLPEWGTIRSIDPSPFEAGTVYIAVNFQQQGDFKPYIYKSADLGNTWNIISNGIPVSNSSSVHQIKEDPSVKGLLWAGTDNALYFSPDDGITWNHLRNNLPPSPIYGIEIQKDFKDLVLATYGRGFYILDDITPIRDFTKRVQAESSHLFSVRNTYRFQPKQGIHGEREMFAGENPHYGAPISYYLKDKSKDSIKISVEDLHGNVIQQLRVKSKPGINRTWWDLRYDHLILPYLKTRPRGKDWVALNKQGDRRMVIYDLDIGPGLVAPMVMPGKYKIKMVADGVASEQMVTVLKDPRSKGSVIDIKMQYDLNMNLYRAIKSCLDMVGRLEKSRASLLSEINSSSNNTKTSSLTAEEEKQWNVEARITNIYQTGARFDAFRDPIQIFERLLALSKDIQRGSADYAPTKQQADAFKELRMQLDEVEKDYKKLSVVN